MNYLIVVFVAMSLYGLVFGYVGAALLSACMAAICVFAARWFSKQDMEWLTDPKYAKSEPDTTQKLAEQECECMRSRF